MVKKNNIDFEENMRKPELLELVKKHKPQKTQYVIDAIAQSHGHKVVRLPPYHCHFNAIELVWAQIKTYVAERNRTFTLRDTETLVNEAVSQITPDKWKNVVNHVWNEIKSSYEEEGVREETIPNIIVSLSDDDDSSEYEGSDASANGFNICLSDYDDLGVAPLPQ